MPGGVTYGLFVCLFVCLYYDIVLAMSIAMSFFLKGYVFILINLCDMTWACYPCNMDGLVEHDIGSY